MNGKKKGDKAFRVSGRLAQLEARVHEKTSFPLQTRQQIGPGLAADTQATERR